MNKEVQRYVDAVPEERKALFDAVYAWPSLAPYCILNSAAPVAQSDRAPDFESVGRGFEPLRARFCYIVEWKVRFI
jgi:hypothetical protein